MYRLSQVSVLLLSSVVANAAAIVFSAFPPTSIPEAISQAPNGFGSNGGNFFVTDATNNPATNATGVVWVVPSGGGAPTSFATTPYNPRGAIFLPSGFGLVGGDYAVANFAGNAINGISNTNFGAITVFGPTGTSSTLYSSSNFNPVTFAVAPTGFDSVGGQLLVSFTGSIAGITAIDSSGNRTDLATGFPFAPYGLAFAPSGFGSFGGDLFFDSDRSPVIEMMDPTGHVSSFATLPLPPNQALRFMAFAPAGFGQWAGDLIVDVPGSGFSATDGMLVAINPNGAIVGELAGLNPRGFTFINGGANLLVNEVEPRVFEVGPNDFASIPEPASVTLVGLGLLTLVSASFRRRR